MTSARILLLASLCASLALWRPLEAAAAAKYSIVGHIPAPGGAWDYSVIDQKSNRLYLAQSGVTALDLKSLTVTPGLVTAKISHGLALLGNGSVAVDDAQAKTVIVFDGVNGQVLSTIATADRNLVDGMHALDALILEPRTGLLAAINGESGLMLLIEVKTGRVADTISIEGHPEFGAADGIGHIFLNVNHGKSSEIVVVDVSARSVTGHIPLHACAEATGLAFDEADHLILSVCANGFLKVIDAHSARLVANLAVGHGADAVMFDPHRRHAFIAAAESGTLSVVAVGGAVHAMLIQTLAMPKGTRLGAVDAETGRVYLPSARFRPPQPPILYPSVVPGSFEFLVVASD